jgi:hypothetical protein
MPGSVADFAGLLKPDYAQFSGVFWALGGLYYPRNNAKSLNIEAGRRSSAPRPLTKMNSASAQDG